MKVDRHLNFLDGNVLDVVSTHVNAGKEEYGIGDLSMEPLRFIEGKPAELRSNHPKDVAAHGQQDHGDIDGKGQARTAREPDRISQGIQSGQTSISGLFIPEKDCESIIASMITIPVNENQRHLPAKDEQTDVKSMEEKVEGKLRQRELPSPPKRARIGPHTVQVVE